MESPEESVAPARPPLAQRKRKCLIFLLVWALISGSIFGIVDAEWETPLLFLDMIVFLIAIIKWTYHDAEQHDFSLWRYFVPLMVLCPGPLLVMPVYFVRSRGWAGGMIATLLSFAFVALQFAIDLAATYVASELYWNS